MLSSRAAFAGMSVGTRLGRGVNVADREELALASVLVRKEEATSLEHRVRDVFGIVLPRGPRRVSAGDIAFMGAGPGAWLATHERAGSGFAVSLKEKLGQVASVSDQSDGYAVLRLSGPRVRDTLAKMCPVDLHPRAFGCDEVAVTAAGHIGATLWRLEDAADGSPAFEIAVYRSFAADFWHLLMESAAEFA
jgi:heterotetrameric sarcosine oxidase gamma subunit